VIADGRNAQPLLSIDRGEPCRWFLPSQAARSARKTAIAGSLVPSGDLIERRTSAEEIRRGENLGVAGIWYLAGHFARGNVIVVRDQSGREFARGLTLFKYGASSQPIWLATLSFTATISYLRNERDYARQLLPSRLNMMRTLSTIDLFVACSG
jgi:glutamate 5-kinase